MIHAEKPLIGFFPCFSSMGETIPLVKIAKSYMEIGGKAIFFSHEGKYEYLAENIGCKVVRLGNLMGEDSDELIQLYRDGVPFEKITVRQFKERTIERAVKEEIEAFTKSRIDLIMSAFNPTSSISARALKIPLVVLSSGTAIPPYHKSGFATFPENYENFFTRMVPKSLKNRIAKWYFLHNKTLVKEFNKVNKKYHVRPFKYCNDIFFGDHTLVCDDINFLGIQPSEDFPLENYIGPIVAGELFKERKNKIDFDVINHLKRPGKSIVLVMGSASKFDKLLLKIVEILNETDYNVIAVYSNPQNKEKLPETNENILFKEFVPLDEILKKVDLAITHGGRGTIYTIAYSGKPAICIPMLMEHQYNIDNLVRNGCAIRLSWKYFKPRELVQSINKIFDNYDTYLKNSKKLSEKLQKEDGAKKAVKRLMEITQIK
ncbi:MAG: glycosyltransferase family 1 protein [Thermoplasmatales archaeon]|nr:MAG: glycosyltransferase family 1 protein [Thermoplasmatales archaeon]